jgi:hypothetical protein
MDIEKYIEEFEFRNLNGTSRDAWYESLLADLRTTLTAVDTEAEARGREQAEHEAFESQQVLWERLEKWDDEWRAENPRERALTNADALKLIEWKLERVAEEAEVRGKAKESARRDGIEKAIEQSIIDQHVTLAKEEALDGRAEEMEEAYEEGRRSALEEVRKGIPIKKEAGIHKIYLSWQDRLKNFGYNECRDAILTHLDTLSSNM